VKKKRISISLQMSSPKYMDIKVNSFNCESPNHTPTKSYFASAYQVLSSSPNALNKMNLNSYAISQVKKNNPLVKLMDSDTVQNTYSNTNKNAKVCANKDEINIVKNINNNTNIKDVLNNINIMNKNFNFNNESALQEKIINAKCNINKNSVDNSFIDIKSIKDSTNSTVNNGNNQDSSDFFSKKSIKGLFENKTSDKNLSQLSYQLSKTSLNYANKNEINKDEKGEIKLNFNKPLETEAIADIVFKKQEVHEVEKMHGNAKSNEKVELQKSLYSCQLSLSPKEKIIESSLNNASMNINISGKKSSLTKEDFESTKVIKENARKMLLANGPHKPVTARKSRSVKFSGENEECPFRKFEAPVSVTTSPIFLVNSTIKPFLETRCNLTTFSEFKQRMIIKKPILIEKAGLLIEESEKTNGHLANFIKNADVKKEHGVFKSRPSHVTYGPSASYSLFSNMEKDKIRVVIQVQNLAYQKEIYVRYTFNNWLTSKDVQATYLNSLNVTSYISKKFHESTSINSNASSQERNSTGIDDSESKVISKSVDRFVADIEIPSYIMDFMNYDNNFFNHNGHFNTTSGEFEDDLFLKDRRRYSQSLGEEWDNDIINKCTLKFAAFYRVNDQEYWENNNNLNYTIDISRVLYIPTKKVYVRSRTPEIIKSRMVNFTNAFYNEVKSEKEFELKSILKTEDRGNVNHSKLQNQEKADRQSKIESKILAKCELREKCIRETIQKELSGSTFFKQMGINPTILNTIINSNRVSTRNNIIKMIMYYQRKAGITNPIIPIEKETSIKFEGK
jgi:hypothetical protein